jgi:GDP-L-fucose synthase
LTDQHAVRQFFDAERPDVVFIAAAKVGGIAANNSYPAEFFHQNVAIQTNVIHESWRCNVQRLIFLGSSCIYPRDCPQPIREEYLLTGPLEATNRSYAIAKIAGVEMCWSYNRQFSTRYLAVMPTNLYGPGDNYDAETSHVLPALIGRFHEAKTMHRQTVEVWGSGTPRREFLHSDDLGDACVFLMNLPDNDFDSLCSKAAPPLINVGWGVDLSIAELAEAIKKVVGYKGNIAWNPKMPDGTPQKLLMVSRMKSLGWRPRVQLQEGLKTTYQMFLTGVEGRRVARQGAS